jgi:ribosome assembly protein YihI (activator of Der GTPase)|tara:strand:- start:189 stop:368 length:180 start_codon:yes stop_codon:yes gene_type:complete
MKSKRQVSNLLERANQLTYSLENAVRARKADQSFVVEKLVQIKELLKKAEHNVNLEYEG